MSAPFKVLLFCTFIVTGLIFVVLYRFDLLKFRTEQQLIQLIPTPSEKPRAIPQFEQGIDLENGKKLFETKTCILCHGANGKANTPMGRAVSATDLTEPDFKNNTKKLPRMDYIFYIIENGVSGTAMVSFKDQIPSDKDKLDLSAYVSSLKQ